MKKLLILFICFALAFSLSSCNPTVSPPDTNIPGNTDTDPAPTKAEETAWSALYEKYSLAINTASDHASRAGNALELLGIYSGETDLALSASFFEKNGLSDTKKAFEMLDIMSINYHESGNTASVSAQSAAGEALEYILQYDGVNSAEYTFKRNGAVQYVLTLCVTDEYTAKTYADYTSNTENRLIVLPNGDLTFGVLNNLNSKITLFKNPSIASSDTFLSLDELYEVKGNVYKKIK